MDFDQLDNHNLIYFPCKGKLPAITQWQKSIASKRIKEKSNYGILCGAASNITVIDIDLKEDGIVKSGLDIWERLLKEFNNGEDLITPIVKTGKGGYHIYFKYNPNIKTGTNLMQGYNDAGFKVKYSIDVRNDGGYVVAAGSIHPDTKKKYKFIQEFDECEPIEMPKFVIEALTMDINVGSKLTFIPRSINKISTPDIIESEEYTPDNFDPEIFREIILSLDKNRAHSYDDWLKVCWAVGGIDKKYKWNNLDALIEFSKKSPKFTSDSEVEKNYEEGDGRLGMGSLWFWLKEDDPLKFKALYQRYKEQNKKNYYYGDYRLLMDDYVKQGFLHKSQVEEYLRSALVKIDNGGNTRFLSRNRDDNDADTWELLRNIPFSDNKINFNLPADDKEQVAKSSFNKVLQDCSVLSSFPIYDKLDFRPYLREEQKDYRDGQVFNLFGGFPHNPDGDYDAECIKPILQCMRDVLSAGNEDFYRYYIRYLAHAVQYPNEKPGIAIILISKEGLGKDMINHDFLKNVFGAKLVHRVNDLSSITRTFNKKMEGKLITVIGEIKSYCNELDSEKLKGIITDTTINIEPKGKDPYEINDFQRFIAHTNNSVPVGIKPDDRRFVIHKISPDFIQNRDYYNKLVKVVKDPKVAMDFFKYLAQMDLSDFDIRNKPMTLAKRELQILTASTAYRFMADVCTRRWTLKEVVLKGDDIKIHSAGLYNNYTEWIVENGEKNKLSLKTFKQNLEDKQFVECDKRMRLFNKLANGYRTSYTELNKLFSDYILEKKEYAPEEGEGESDDE